MAKGKHEYKHSRNRNKQTKKPSTPVIPLTPAQRTIHLRERKWSPDLTPTKKWSRISGQHEDYVRREVTTYLGMVVGSSDADERVGKRKGKDIYSSLINRLPPSEKPQIGVTGRIKISLKEGYKVGEDDTLVPPGMIRLNPATTLVDERHMGAEYDFAYKGSFDDLANYFRKRPHIKWSISNPAIYDV
jgi:hypothetical protein